MDWDKLIDWLQERRYLVIAAIVILSALGFGVSIRTPYVTPEQAVGSHEAHEHHDRFKETVKDLKDNRRWLSYYQSQISQLKAIAKTRDLRPDEQAILDGLMREQPLLFESREQKLKDLEDYRPKPDPLN